MQLRFITNKRISLLLSRKKGILLSAKFKLLMTVIRSHNKREREEVRKSRSLRMTITALANGIVGGHHYTDHLYSKSRYSSKGHPWNPVQKIGISLQINSLSGNTSLILSLHRAYHSGSLLRSRTQFLLRLYSLPNFGR